MIRNDVALNIIRLIHSTLFIISCSALYPRNTYAEPAPASVEKAKVGMLLTLSGSFASAGEDCRLGIVAGLSVAGIPPSFDIVYADSQNDPTTAISEFRKLVQVDKAIAVYTHRSSISMALNPVSMQSEIPLLGAAGHKDFASGNKFAVQLWARSDDEGHFLATEFIQRGYKRAALIFTEDEWTSAVSQGFREKYEELGGSLSFDHAVLPSETDFRTALLQLKRSMPDAIYMNMLLPQISPIIKQAHGLKVSGAIFSNFYVAKQEVVDAVGVSALEGIKFVEMDTNLPVFKSKLGLGEGETPTSLSLASYIATLLIAQTFTEAPTVRTVEDFRTALLRQKEVRTPDYTYPIKDRYVQFPLTIKTLKNGKSQSD